MIFLIAGEVTSPAILKVVTMKCINGVYWCSRMGLSGGKPCCGYLLAVGETKFINSLGVINEPCPLPPADTEQVNLNRQLEFKPVDTEEKF